MAHKQNTEHISVILLSWNRMENVKLILERLLPAQIVSEIILWNNNPSVTLAFEHPKLTIINSPKNFYSRAHLVAAGLAEHNTILCQDDDLILTEQHIKALHEEYKKNPSRIYGCFGRNLDGTRYVCDNAVGEVDIVLGRVMLFHKSLLAYFFKWLKGFENDPIEHDVLFSLAIPSRHWIIDMEPPEELPSPFSFDSRTDHLKRRQEMVNFCLKMRALEKNLRASS